MSSPPPLHRDLTTLLKILGYAVTVQPGRQARLSGQTGPLFPLYQRRFAYSQGDKALQKKEAGNPSDNGQPEKSFPAHSTDQESTQGA